MFPINPHFHGIYRYQDTIVSGQEPINTHPHVHVLQIGNVVYSMPLSKVIQQWDIEAGNSVIRNQIQTVTLIVKLPGHLPLCRGGRWWRLYLNNTRYCWMSVHPLELFVILTPFFYLSVFVRFFAWKKKDYLKFIKFIACYYARGKYGQRVEEDVQGEHSPCQLQRDGLKNMPGVVL